MKTIGEAVKEWREASGLKHPDVARLVNEAHGHGGPPLNVKYQDIQNLEKKGKRPPRYFAPLLKVMGTTADALTRGEVPPPLKDRRGQVFLPLPCDRPADYNATRPRPTDAEWAVIDDFNQLLPSEREEWRKKLRERAEQARQDVLQWLSRQRQSEHQSDEPAENHTTISSPSQTHET